MAFRNLAGKSLVIVPPPPSRFTLSEWYLNNRYRFRSCEDQQQLAERVISESGRIVDLIDDATKCNKIESDKKLEEKIRDIEFLKGENEIQKKEACLEEDALKTYKERIMDALEALKEQALRICKKCIILRYALCFKLIMILQHI